MNRRPIFQAARSLGAHFNSNADVAVMDAAIDAAIADLVQPQVILVPAEPVVQVVVPAPVISLVPTEGMSSWQRMVDTSLLKLAFPNNSSTELAKWSEPCRLSMVRWGIDLPREICSFLANMNVESAGLTRLTESLNYSTQALVAKFGRHRISEAQAQKYGRNSQHPANEEMLANILYGGEFGRKQLGNTKPGDGWLFKGYGPKQITGRDNQTRFAKAMGIPVEEVPAFVRTYLGGMMSAGWFWKTHDLDAKAATPGVEDDRRAINGGTFGLPEVEHTFNLLLEELLHREARR